MEGFHCSVGNQQHTIGYLYEIQASYRKYTQKQELLTMKHGQIKHGQSKGKETGRATSLDKMLFKAKYVKRNKDDHFTGKNHSF